MSNEEDVILPLMASLRSSRATRDVMHERLRQIHGEGYTHEHDDAHTDGSIAVAAACYAAPLSVHFRGDVGVTLRRLVWPWDLKMWKPFIHRRNLVRAAALLIAEIERIDRKEAADVK